MQTGSGEQTTATSGRSPARRRGAGTPTHGTADTPRVLVRLPDLRPSTAPERTESESPAVQSAGGNRYRWDQGVERGLERGPRTESIEKSPVLWGLLERLVNYLLAAVDLVARLVRRPSAAMAAILAMGVQLVAFLAYLQWAVPKPAATEPAPIAVSRVPGIPLAAPEPTLAPPRPAENKVEFPANSPRLGDPRDFPPWENWTPPQELPTPAPTSDASANMQPSAGFTARPEIEVAAKPAIQTTGDASRPIRPRSAARLSGEIKRIVPETNHEHARPGLY
jgi:hypothetical protein